MADTKVSNLTALTSMVSGDAFIVSDDLSGTPETKTITIDNLLANIPVDVTIKTGAGLDIVDITDSNIPYMSASGFADSPITTDGVDVTVKTGAELDIADITDGNIPYMGASGFADSPLSYDGSDISSTANIILAENALTGTSQTISDDDVYSFTPPASVGTMIVFASQSGSDAYGVVSYRVASTNFTKLIATAGDVEVTTGALTGTTGTDVKLTVSANDSDGKVYIENRTGAARTFKFILFS